MTELRFQSSVRSAYVALVSILVLGAVAIPVVISQLEIYLRKESVPLRRTLNTIDDDLGRWDRAKGKDGEPKEDAVFGVEMIEGLGTELYLDRWMTSRGRDVNVHVAYYTGMIDDVPHVPERCWDANGLTQSISPRVVDLDLDFKDASTVGSPVNRATGEPYPMVDILELGEPVPVHLPVGGPRMTITQFDLDDKKPRLKQVGGYFFIANGRMAPSAGDVRMMAFDPSEKYAYYCKVQLTYQGTVRSGQDDDAVVEEFLEIAEDLLPRLIPEVMHCLPDWPEIEGSAKPVAAAANAPTETDPLQESNLRPDDFRPSYS